MKKLSFLGVLLGFSLAAPAFADTKISCTSLVSSSQSEENMGPFETVLKPTKKGTEQVEAGKISLPLAMNAKSQAFDLELRSDGSPLFLSTKLKGVYLQVGSHIDGSRNVVALRLQDAHIVCEALPKE